MVRIRDEAKSMATKFYFGFQLQPGKSLDTKFYFGFLLQWFHFVGVSNFVAVLCHQKKNARKNNAQGRKYCSPMMTCSLYLYYLE